MSLVYAKMSDEIGCALHVFLHAAVACGTEILMHEGYHFYESLLTYVAHMDLVGDLLQGTCHARASEILLLKFVRYLPRIS
jgi:hypothetical protein